MKSNGDTSIDIEKLKQREERFGASVSDTLKKVGFDWLLSHSPCLCVSALQANENEKKRKRAERFGTQDATAIAKETPTNNNIENLSGTAANDDKKSLRAERFGLNCENDKMKARAARFAK